MKQALAAFISFPFLTSCAQSHAVNFPPRAFATQPNQRVVITTSRGRTEVRSVLGSRDIMVGGTVRTSAPSPIAAELVAQGVRVVEASVPGPGEPVLRLEVMGIPAGSSTHLEAEFLVPQDIRLEIRDGPEDLFIRGLQAGVTIHDGAGDIELQEFAGGVEIEDVDGNIHIYRGVGPVKVKDRRGDIVIEEVTGHIDISDHEDEVRIESVTGDLVLGKHNRGSVRIKNLDGHFTIREWINNNTQPIINTIWKPPGAPAGPSPAAVKVKGEGPAGKNEP